MISGAISYPQRADWSHASLTEIVDQQSIALAASNMKAQNSPIGTALDPSQTDGLCWSIPLWGERGLIGFFLLGGKHNGNLFTQEEIEIARASGERLIDTQTGIEIGQRLLALQRRQLAESQLLDRRARRILHDDVLPQLHTALLALAALPPAPTGDDEQPSILVQKSSVPHLKEQRGDRTFREDYNNIDQVAMLLTDTHRQIAALLRTMPARAMPQLSELGLVGALQALAADELANAFDAVRWHADAAAEQTAATLAPLTQEVLFYATREAMRNAAHHGRSGDPQRALELDVSVTQQNGLHIQVQDNGIGLPKPPNDETAHAAAEVLQGGHGLALHSTLLAIVGGELSIKSAPAAGVCVSIWLPSGLA